MTSPAGCTSANGAVGWRLYASATSSGASLAELLTSPSWTPYQSYQLQAVLNTATVIPIGATATITALPSGTSKVPQVNTAFPRTIGASQSYPAFPSTSIAANTNVVPLGTINLPAGFMNTLGRSFQVCGHEYSVTGTEGAITLQGTITTAGVVGTNSTLYTAAAVASTSTSAPISVNFCVTYTTVAVSTSATSTAGAIEAHGWQIVSLAGTAPGTVYQDIATSTVGSLNLWVQQQLAFNAVGDGTVVSATTQLRQLEVFPLN